ncbi:MAG: HAD-IIIA family hydrolase [Deltaproteobacteria bacterium]|nr:HAD-IIIA family hydrolase [Deltaproteobacteria bacterium]
MKGIVFLDRDGTLIEEVGYLSDPSSLREIPGAAEALRELAEAGLALVVVSNQAGLARGTFGEDRMEAVRCAFEEHFRARGVRFDAVEYCPHHPDGVVEKYRMACRCRKPATGMAEAAMERLRLPRSCRKWVVGDKMADILMGKRLSAETVLVATGYGRSEMEAAAAGTERPDAFVPGIREAARWILERIG